ncbi:band 7 protein AGAP004871-like [Rhodnius prolixus]
MLSQVEEQDGTLEKRKEHDLRFSPNGGVKIAESVCLFLTVISVIILFPLSLFFCFRIVNQFERAVILRFGKLRKGRARGPGLIFVLVCIDNVMKVDLRTATYAIPPQEVLTKDSCTVSVDAVVYYSVSDPIRAVVQVVSFRYSTCTLAATILRNIMGQKNLTEILSERESIAFVIKEALDSATHPWGITVERVEIKDVRLPVQMQRAMAAEAEATRDARAKVIAAEGELRAARNLKEASDIISKNPTALQLRYLQTLNSIASERNSTIIFPMPVDLVSAFIR